MVAGIDQLEAKISVEELQRLGRELVPIIELLGLRIQSVEHGLVRVRIEYRDEFVRPGGSIAGAVLLAAADFAVWGCILSVMGRTDLTMTTNLNFNFLRRPALSDVIAEAKLLKLGRRLAVGEVQLYSNFGEDHESLIGHATCTYSVAPS